MGASLEGERLKHKLQQMDDYDFEHFVADLWERQGWTTEVEQQSGDAGVDVRAVKTSPYRQKQLIQAKRYASSTKVGGPDIQQYYSLKDQEEGVDAAVIVTTSSFTKSAKDRAQDLNVKLVDGADLVSMIERFEAYDIVDTYVTTKSSGTEISQHTTSSQKPQVGENDQIQVLDVPFIEFEYTKGSTPEGVDITKTRWYYAIYVGIIAYTIVIFTSGSGSLGDIALRIGFILSPLAILGDSYSMGIFSPKEWEYWGVILASAIPILGIVASVYYLLYRRGVRLDIEQRR